MPRPNRTPNRGKRKSSEGISQIDNELAVNTEQPNTSEGDKNIPDSEPVPSDIDPGDEQKELDPNACTKNPKKTRKRRKKGDKIDESVERKYLCSHCGFRTMTLAALSNHNRSHTRPKKEKQKEDFLCATCGYQTNSSTNYKRHLKRHEPGRVIRRKRVLQKCEPCQYQTDHSGSWKDHLRSRAHYVLSNNLNENTAIGKINCPDCDTVLRLMKDLDSHLEAEHGYKLESEQISFNSMEEFNSWLDSLLAKNQKYAKLRVQTRFSTMYYCHRSGKYKAAVTTRKRALKKHGSVKSEKACPSRVSITWRDGIYNVTHYKTHVGHDLDPVQVPIPLAYKEQIASDLASGMSKAEVRSKHRQLFKSQGLRPLHSKDLHNISRQFGLSEILKELQDAPKPESNPSTPESNDDNVSFWELTAEEAQLVREDESTPSVPRVPEPPAPNPSSQFVSLQNQLNELMQLVQTREDAELVVNLPSSPVRTAIAQLQTECQQGAGS